MLQNLKNATKNWWLLLILGIICIGFGIAVLCTMGAGTAVLAILLIINLILVGILGIIFVISNRKEIPSWGWNLVIPILVLGAGVALCFFPNVSMIIICVIFALAILFKSIEAICYAISMSKIKGSGWGWTLAAGIIGLIIAIFLFIRPAFLGLLLNLLVGIALLVMGIESIAVSIQLSKVRGKINKVEDELSKVK